MDSRQNIDAQNQENDIGNDNDGGEVCIYPHRVYKNSYLRSAMTLLCIGMPIATMLIPAALQAILDEQNPNRAAILYGTTGATALASVTSMCSILFFGTKKNSKMDNEETESLKHNHKPQIV